MKIKKIISMLLCIAMFSTLFVSFDINAYDDVEYAVKNNFDGTSSVEQGYNALKSNIINCRFCYAYDYDGDGHQEGYAFSGRWEEGIINGKLWFIDANGNYSLIKEDFNCKDELFKPTLVYAGDQIFLVSNEEQNGKIVSLICGCKNGSHYFPAISETVSEFHFESPHYYACVYYDYNNLLAEEYFYDKSTGEFVVDTEYQKSTDISVIINGEELYCAQPPILKDD